MWDASAMGTDFFTGAFKEAVFHAVVITDFDAIASLKSVVPSAHCNRCDDSFMPLFPIWPIDT